MTNLNLAIGPAQPPEGKTFVYIEQIVKVRYRVPVDTLGDKEAMFDAAAADMGHHHIIREEGADPEYYL